MGVPSESAVSNRYCIVGAGASGIAAAKNLKALDIPFDVIEREDEVGGNWYYGKPCSSAYRSTHLISSKRMTEFPDFPMPDHYPHYPEHTLVLEYLRAYARRFDLYPHIQFNTSVERIERMGRGQWEVTLRTQAGQTEIRHYQGVIIANGHLWDKKYPDYPGSFDGLIIHSKDYKTPDVLRDKRALVVGAGNSGCDIAVEAAHNAARTFHSMRRGYHFIPKFVFGQPADVFAEFGYRLPLALRRFLNTITVRLIVGSPTQFGLPKPDHRLLESHPIVNSQMLYHVGHGDIIPKPEILELRGDSVAFRDGSQDQIDVIVYATGYKITFPFIDQRYLNWGEHGPSLYLHAFHPEYDDLFVVGLLQPDSGVWWLADYQSQLIARLIWAQKNAPEKAADFHRIKAGTQPDMRGGVRHLNTPRHYLEIQHFSYRNLLKRHISLLR